nr:hypothetical protein Iba_chr03aCG3050 [Ipomoea batatas]
MGLDGDRGSGAGGQRRWTATLETGSSSSHLPAMASAMVSWSTTLPITLQGKQVDGEGGAGLHRWLGRRRDGGVDDGERWRSRWCLGMVASAMVTDGEAGGAWRWWRRRWCLEMVSSPSFDIAHDSTVHHQPLEVLYPIGQFDVPNHVQLIVVCSKDWYLANEQEELDSAFEDSNLIHCPNSLSPSLLVLLYIFDWLPPREAPLRLASFESRILCFARF